MKIGIFDSGIGGLTVLHRALIELPKEDYIFYADEEHVPYGTKTREEILAYTTNAVEFLVKQGCEIVVLACNTATSVAAEELRKNVKVPILGIEPAVKPALEHSNHKRVLVIATPMTVKEKKLKDLLHRVDEEHRVDVMATPQLVEFAQREEFNSKEVKQYLKEKFQEICPSDYSEVVLGCTHFNLFKDVLREYFGPDCELIDGSFGTVRNLSATAKRMNLAEGQKGSVTFYSSGKKVEGGEKLAFFHRILERLTEMEQY